MVLIFVILAWSLFTSAGAHTVMDTPLPYNFAALFNGPIWSIATKDTDLSISFPCNPNTKDQNNPITPATAGQRTSWDGGQNQLLHLQSATPHLGGLCAVAITYAVEGSPEFKDPTQWKKIYHIPDCFMVNAPPNNFPIPLAGPSGIGKPPLGLAGHHDAPWAHCAMSDSKVAGCIRSYNIPMHGAMKNGNAIFSWVWKNAVTSTNETYMNCAPMTITGAKNDGTWDKLPNLKQALSIFGGNDAEPVPNQPASPAPSPVPTDAANAAKGMPADLYWLGSSNSPAAITSNPVKRRNDGPATGSAIPTVPTAVVAPTSPAAPAAPTSSVAIPAFKRNARPSIGWWTPW